MDPHRLIQLSSQWIDKLQELIGGDLRAAALIGSVTRPQDFVEGLSDIDLVILVSRPISSQVELELTQALGFQPMILELDQLRELMDLAHPLGFLVAMDSVIIHDSGELLRILESSQLKPTQYTHQILSRSALVALCLGIQEFSWEHYPKAVNHGYHGFRHAARSRILRDQGFFPISDSQLVIHLPSQLSQDFLKLIQFRRDHCQLKKDQASQGLKIAIHGVEQLLGYRIPSLDRIQAQLAEFESARLQSLEFQIESEAVIWLLEISHPRGFFQAQVGPE